MKVGGLLDPLLRLLLSLRKRRPPEGVLLVSSRGPAEMVFLAPVLERFMRLARLGEQVTLLCRADAAGMAFLFPHYLALRRVDFRRLGQLSYRWKSFRDLHHAHYRLVVSLDYLRVADEDEALIAALDAGETAAMLPPPGRDHRKRLAESRRTFTRLVECGPLRQDKIRRWSKFADELLDDRQRCELALLPEERLPQAQRGAAPTVVLFPFSAVAQRQLPVELWRLIVNAVPAPWRVVVAGHRNDFDRNPAYIQLQSLPNVSLETSGFEHLSSILRGARMVVGVDTAGLHLAVLLGAPTLCFASAAFVGAGVPYDEMVAPNNVRFLYTPMDCQGCLGRCKFKPVDGMYPCVAELDTDAMLSAVQDIVARGVV
jgi:hypothetical protein